MAKIEKKYTPADDWSTAHERFVRNQEYRIKKYGMSTTAEKYVKFLNENADGECDDEDVVRREINPFEDEDLMKSVALAERRNIHLNETQQARVEIARRRQRTFVAIGHSVDQEKLMHKHILTHVPPCINLQRAITEEIRDASETAQRERLERDMSIRIRRANTYHENISRLTTPAPRYTLRDSANRPNATFRNRYPDKQATLSDVLPQSYKVQMEKQRKDLREGSMLTMKGRKHKTVADLMEKRGKEKAAQRYKRMPRSELMNARNSQEINTQAFMKHLRTYEHRRAKTIESVPRLNDTIKMLKSK